jgi:hypothetical protein
MILLSHETPLAHEGHRIHGYKYRLTAPLVVRTRICPDEEIITPLIKLTTGGWLELGKNYASDGPSGPTIDTDTFMRGAFVHDALYQLMREGLLPQSWRVLTDMELRRICLEDGMWCLRACWVFTGLQLANGAAAKAA